jgi:hypothetical protein
VQAERAKRYDVCGNETLSLKHASPVETFLDTRDFGPDVIAISRVARNVGLLRVLRIVIRADSDPARQALFANLMQSHRLVRLTYGLHERIRGTWGATLLVGCFGVASFLTIAPSRNRRTRVLAVAQHENARRQVGRVFSWIGAEDCDLLRTGLSALTPWSVVAGLGVLLSRGRLLQVLRIIQTIDRRHGFLVSCRAVAALAWYSRAKTILEADMPDAVLVSSDSNPEEVAFVAAARAFDIPQVFVSHAYPTPLSPPLNFSLSILEGEAAVLAHKRKGPITSEVLLAGIEGDSVPLDPRRFTRSHPVIGVFTSKALSWQTLAAIINDCRDHAQAKQIVIRWHPSMLGPSRLAEFIDDHSQIVVTSRKASLSDVAQQCDWVIADENSNVHLPVLKLGVPTVAIKSLGIYPPSRADQYGFVANGIIFPPVASIRDIQTDALLAFFSGGWSGRFQQYDASYLHPRAAIGAEVRRAIQALVESSTPKTTVK